MEENDDNDESDIGKDQEEKVAPYENVAKQDRF